MKTAIPIIALGAIFSAFSCITLSYISIATPFGPWIAPTVVLFCSIILSLSTSLAASERSIMLTNIQTVASVGGLIAVAIGFTLPMLFFLQPTLFSDLLAQPHMFMLLIGALVITAGGLGAWIGRLLAPYLFNREHLQFSVPRLVFSTITAHNQRSQAWSLMTGFWLSGLMCFLRDGFSVGKSLFAIPALLPTKEWFIMPIFFGHELVVSISPMVWAIGFTAGMSIVAPLIVGLISKYLILYPLNYHSMLLPWTFFAPIKEEIFVTTFCTGLVIAELTAGIFSLRNNLMMRIARNTTINNLRHQFLRARTFVLSTVQKMRNALAGKSRAENRNLLALLEPLLVSALMLIFFVFMGFSGWAALFMSGASAIMAYNISVFSGRTGLAPFGRFVTFVMLPAMILFTLDAYRLTILCIFAGVVMASAINVLFSYKVAEFAGIDRKTTHYYHWIGIIMAAFGVSASLWLLCTHLQLGSAEFFGQRGLSRALLIRSFTGSVDWRILSLGFIYGQCIRLARLSPAMVFGGILTPNSFTIALALGALASQATSRPKEYHALWSGVFAAESLWLIISVLARIM